MLLAEKERITCLLSACWTLCNLILTLSRTLVVLPGHSSARKALQCLSQQLKERMEWRVRPIWEREYVTTTEMTNDAQLWWWMPWLARLPCHMGHRDSCLMNLIENWAILLLGLPFRPVKNPEGIHYYAWVDLFTINAIWIHHVWIVWQSTMWSMPCLP